MSRNRHARHLTFAVAAASNVLRMTAKTLGKWLFVETQTQARKFAITNAVTTTILWTLQIVGTPSDFGVTSGVVSTVLALVYLVLARRLRPPSGNA